jgi:DNA primase
MPQCDYTVLVEGIMDAIHLQQAGINSMFNFGVNYTFSNSKIATLLRSGIDTIYLMFDNDKAGLRATAEYLSSPLSDFFSIKLATELDELDEFFKSGCKDYAEFAEKKIKEQNEMAYLKSIYIDSGC